MKGNNMSTSPLDRLNAKVIAATKAFAQANPNSCFALEIGGARVPFINSKNARDLEFGKVAPMLLTTVSQIAGVEKQSKDYQDAMAIVISGESATVTAPSVAKETYNKMSAQQLPKDVLSFTVPFASPTPRPGRS